MKFAFKLVSLIAFAISVSNFLTFVYCSVRHENWFIAWSNLGSCVLVGATGIYCQHLSNQEAKSDEAAQ